MEGHIMLCCEGVTEKLVTRRDGSKPQVWQTLLALWYKPRDTGLVC